MAAKTRRALIEKRLVDEGEVDFSSLASEFQVSEMTIRRDIDALASSGAVRRVFGGAISLVGKATEPTFESRASAGADVKAHLARATVSLLAAHETVLLDGGSSVLAVARAIRGAGLGLTVVTPSLLAALELADEPDTTVLMTGGRVRAGELTFIGSEAEAALSQYNCDVYVMGVAGVDADRGATEYHREEASVKRAALRSCDRVIVVVDATKLGRVQLMNVAPLSSISVIVTDGDPADPALQAAREAGVEVICVPALGVKEIEL